MDGWGYWWRVGSADRIWNQKWVRWDLAYVLWVAPGAVMRGLGETLAAGARTTVGARLYISTAESTQIIEPWPFASFDSGIISELHALTVISGPPFSTFVVVNLQLTLGIPPCPHPTLERCPLLSAISRSAIPVQHLLITQHHTSPLIRNNGWPRE